MYQEIPDYDEETLTYVRIVNSVSGSWCKTEFNKTLQESNLLAQGSVNQD